jgi:glycerophosphoryl diester phosphodiesterase
MPVRDTGKKPSTIARSTGASAFICKHTQLRKRFAEDAHKHKLMLGCYVINTEKDLEKVRRYGVDAVITDYPGKIRAALG